MTGTNRGGHPQQLTFASFLPLTHPRSVGLTIDERFAQFDRANPQVYAELRRLALDLRKSGVERYAIKALWEVLRYHSSLQLGTDGAWTLNNDYTSRYARKLMRCEPALASFFRTRQTRQGAAA